MSTHFLTLIPTYLVKSKAPSKIPSEPATINNQFNNRYKTMFSLQKIVLVIIVIN